MYSSKIRKLHGGKPDHDATRGLSPDLVEVDKRQCTSTTPFWSNSNRFLGLSLLLHLDLDEEKKT